MVTADQLSSVEEIADRIQEAARSRTRIVPVGGGRHGGVADGEARQVSITEGMRGIVAYDPAELIVTVEAGVAVEALDAVLGEHGQAWAGDGVTGSTVGGVIASAASSTRRLVTGPVRDSVTGLEFVDGRGRVIRVGGRTVKNSTGLDLVRLLVGSRGTLGIITKAHLRVLPRPRARSVVRAPQVDIRAGIAAARDARVLAAAIADPSGVRFVLEGWREDVAVDVQMLVARVGGACEAPDDSKAVIAARPWAAWPAAALLTVRPSAVEMLAARCPGDWAALLSTGHLWVGAHRPADLLPICRAAIQSGGHATLVSEPGWPRVEDGAAGDAGIGERVKAAFDPDAAFPSLAVWRAS